MQNPLFKVLPLPALLCAALAGTAAPLPDCVAQAGQAGATALPDEDVTAAVERRLLRDPLVEAHLVDVLTRNGVVDLSGDIDSFVTKKRCADLARTVRGVRSVVNRLEVRPTLTPEDGVLRKRIREAIAADPAADAFEIDVEVENGTVTLSGTVESWGERRLTAQVAGAVTGVLDLVNEIEVEFDADRTPTEIVRDIEGRLAADVWVDARDIEVGLENGVVTLNGTVASAAARERAYHLSRVAGVRRVEILDLKVDETATARWTEPLPKWTDERIEKAVQDAILRDPRVAAFKITTAVDNGVVTLTGTVDNLRARQAAAQDARNTRGVSRVVDRIKVRTERDYSDDAVAAAVREALDRNPYTQPHDIGVRVVNRKVWLSGEVDSRMARSEAGEIAAATRGVVAVSNRLVTGQMEPGFVTQDDRELRRTILEDLWWNPYVDHQGIEVQVVAGVATLTGEVFSWFERTMAHDIAREAGADRVVNNLSVEVDGTDR